MVSNLCTQTSDHFKKENSKAEMLKSAKNIVDDHKRHLRNLIPLEKSHFLTLLISLVALLTRR